MSDWLAGRSAWLVLLITPILPLVLSACSGGGATERDGVTSRPDEPSATVSGEGGDRRVVTVVAINDFHGGLYEQAVRHDEGRVLGGLPVLVGAVRALRDEVPDLLLLDGGDLFQGSWPVNATQGMGGVEAFHLLGVDVAAVGNHEFDYGPLEAAAAETNHPLRGALYAAFEASRFQWLSANVRERQQDGQLVPWRPPGLQPTSIIEHNGVRLGIIGLTTTETPETTLYRHVADLVFDDPVETVRAALPGLEEAGVDAVIVVGHLTGTCTEPGSSELFATTASCRANGEIGRLIDELPYGAVDLIVAGHEHIVVADRARDTLVVEAMSHGRALVRVDLVFGSDGFDPDASVIHEPWILDHTPIDPGCDGGEYPTAPIEVGGRSVTPSAEAVALVDDLEARAGSLCEVLGCSDVTLARDRGTESVIGNLVADAMAASLSDAEIDVAIQNSGGLRADIAPGEIRREDLHAVMPFDNRIVVVELTGDELRRLFRIGSSGAHGIFQVAGASYRFDPSIEMGDDLNGDSQVETWERDRLCWLRVGDEPVEPSATYRVAVNDFMYTGGDHLGPVLEGREIVEEGPLVREALYDFVAGREACLDLPAAASARVEVGPCP